MYTKMRLIIIQILVATILVSACSSTTNKQLNEQVIDPQDSIYRVVDEPVISSKNAIDHVEDEQVITPRNAIYRAAEAAPRSIDGVFEFTVKGAGKDDDWIFLNSEEDYRDQRSLNIGIHPKVTARFMAINGMPPGLFFKGKLIRVTGSAKRVRIDFTFRGEKTGKYYYQTQVRVTELNQIEVVPNDT